MSLSISKMQNVEVRLNPTAEVLAELDSALVKAASGSADPRREWLRLAPHYLQRNALQLPRSHFSIFPSELAVKPFGNIPTTERIQPPASGFQKHELLLVRNAESWKAVVVFAKYAGKRKKKRKKKAKRRLALSIVSGGLPSLGKRR
jgi:hypothetical protein